MLEVKRILKKFEQKLRTPVIVLFAAAILALVLMNLEFNLLEAKLYDMRMSRGLQAKPDRGIVLVSIDDSTVKAIDEFSPLPLDFHARLLERMETLRPKALGYLVDMNRVNQLDPELFRSEWGKRFTSAANRMEAAGISVLLGTPYDVTGEVIPPYPLSALPHALAFIHKDGNVFADDKVTRRAMTYLDGKPVFHTELAQRLGYLAPGKAPRGNYRIEQIIDGQYFFFRYHGDTTLHPTTDGKAKFAGGSYPIYSFKDVMSGKIPPRAFEDKIVLVGSLTKDDSGDFALTPYSKTPFTNPKLLVHANILDAVIHDHGIVRAPTWVSYAVTFLVIASVLWWVLHSTPLQGVIATLGLAAAFGIIAQAVFQLQGVWIRESQPLVGIFLGYYLAVPYRLIVEYKKRWDYQRRNELLIQVEELKTNFLSLVTHDLKTPVARIQGLSEVLLKKAADRLIDRDKETIGNILNSTDELNRFISSILELNRVESNRISLNLESKDVNQLIERSVEGFKAQARARGQRIEMALEPLFPIKVDASLISKILNNLIDNALKYSPEGCDVVVISREVEPFVEILVKDSGIGLTEAERANLFTRFYRAKNDTTARITGTGLGLYLTKYFVEAHDGQVAVESAPGQGSTFIIRFPLGSAAPAPAAEQASAILKGLTRMIAGIKKEKKEKENV